MSACSAIRWSWNRCWVCAARRSSGRLGTGSTHCLRSYSRYRFALRKQSTKRDGLEEFEAASLVYVLSADPNSIGPLVKLGWKGPDSSNEIADIALWTDDYVNLMVPLYEVFIDNDWY